MADQRAIVILVHGFCRTARDMSFLRKALENRGHMARAVNLPTTLGAFETCCDKFAKYIEPLRQRYDTLHLVGHSMGGLIIRWYLSVYGSQQIGRSVFIATPHQGSALADMLLRHIPFSRRFLPALTILASGAPGRIPEPADVPVGVIAGSDHRLLSGFLLPRPNDGRVALAATRLNRMTDFIILNHRHTRIHHRRETAAQIHHFLTFGVFYHTCLDLDQTSGRSSICGKAETMIKANARKTRRD